MDSSQYDNLRQLVIFAPGILLAITFHEASHGFVAYKLGDPTAKFVGRLTLNPLAHIDLFGTIILPLMLAFFHMPPFGYAKPVPINAMNFKNPRKGMAISAAAGPVTNLILALASTIILKIILQPLSLVFPESATDMVLKPLIMIFTASAFINVVLAVFNMIPIPPLDGGRVLTGFLPSKHAMTFSKIEPFGFIIVLILLYTGIASYMILPIIYFILKLLQVY